jgi:hypothetical protein
MKDTKVPTLHTHCPTCQHCTYLHQHAGGLVVCMGCRLESTTCIVTRDPAALQLLLRMIFAENAHDSHEKHGV